MPPDLPASGDAVSRPRRSAGAGSVSEAGPSGAPRRATTGSGSVGLGSALGWTVLGTILPGLGLWRSGRKVIGSLVMAVVLLLLGGTVGFAVTQGPALVSLATNPQVLQGVAVALLVLAVAWVIVIGATHLALRPAGTATGQRLVGAILVAVLSFAVAAPLGLGANVAYSASSLVKTVFVPSDDDHKSETVPTITNTVDPWADIARLNILILGGDSGTGRSEKLGMRADTVIVASVDTATGATTLFSLPRQTARMPFPKGSKLAEAFPNGWYDPRNPGNRDYWLSAMYPFAPTYVEKDILGKTKHLPEDIMKVSVGEALGLDIDYFVNVNMDGFKDIINALGGVTLNVNSPLPIGGDSDRNILPTGWIEPGPDQRFGGRMALWYARGRWGYDDYSRMGRQRCVINAVVDQANPQNVLANFEKIAAAGKNTVTTDIPDTMVGPLLTLANRVKGTTLRSIVFQHKVDGFSTTDPDWALVRKQVKKALKESKQSNTELATNPAVSVSPTGSPSSSPSASPSKSAKPKSADLTDECGYHPSKKKILGYPGTRDNPLGYRQGK